MKKNIILWSVGLSFVAMFIILACYKYTFPNGLVYDRGDWGTFGDYFGGVLNPIIGVVNIYLLAYISREVASLDGTRHLESLKIQKQVALYELKHTALIGAVKILTAIHEISKEPTEVIQSKIPDLRNDLFSFYRVHSHLIKSFQDAETTFRSPIQALLNTSNQMFYDRQGNLGKAKELDELMSEHQSTFLDLMERLVAGAQRELEL
jgi:hypothetical protein